MSATIHVVNKQKEALVLAIKESERNESERLARFAIINSKVEKDKWKERFHKERQREQTKIECLMQDYRTLQQKSEQQDLSGFLEARKAAKLRQISSKSPFGENQILPNRFVGLENLNDVVGLLQVSRCIFSLTYFFTSYFWKT